MSRRFSRRTFAMGVGGGTAAAALAWGFRELHLQPSTPGDQQLAAAGHYSHAEYDGWLVTTLDKKRFLLALVYSAGWYPEEATQGSTWRWTHGIATLSFRNPLADSVFHLEYDARADLFEDAHRTVTISVGARVLHSFIANAAGPQRISIPVPAAVLGHNRTVDIQLGVDRTFVPASLIVGSGDARELGILVYHAVVELAPVTPP